MTTKLEIEALLLKEKMRQQPNKASVQFLQKVIEGYMVTKPDFANTMRTVDSVQEYFGGPVPLRPECRLVLAFVGGYYIQKLDSGSYLYEVFDNNEADEMHTKILANNIKDCVSFIWKSEANNKFNKIK
jgi:hypothetical protein